MKKQLSHPSVIALVALISSCLLISILPQVATTQSGCTNPPTQGRTTAWSQGAPVKVNIDPTFPQAQRDAIEAAFKNWQNSSGNNSGVTFSFTYNSTPITGPNTYQVNSRTISGGQAETGGTANSSNTNRETAFTNVDP